MPANQPNFHRASRIAILAEWSASGVTGARAPLPAEAAFVERLKRLEGAAFNPIPMPNLDSVAYHTQVSMLLDALDQFPLRVDMAFDAMWRAFEGSLLSSNTTAALEDFTVAISAHPGLVKAMAGGMPGRVGEFCVSRLVADNDSYLDKRALTRTIRAVGANSLFLELRQLVADKYLTDPADFSSIRKGQRLVLRALRGDALLLQGETIVMDHRSQAGVLVSGFLYTYRNDRTHAGTPSPFTSSAATLKTYALPLYAFVTTYALFLFQLLQTHGDAVGFSVEDVQTNLESNLVRARSLLGRHWDG